ARIELGRIVREELEERGKRIASEIYQTLLPLAADSKINDPLRAEMILNSAFLVESAREEEFDKTVETIEGRFGDKISFKYVSSPPYDFVDLNIGE
ncbi:MAG: GvpL/GvpF family gas vesicle protein, partial [Nitrososphaerota archaeon]|nr:GvpL/GvpF family gas vesicle protein [Nitrososphaerota archaeon]